MSERWSDDEIRQWCLNEMRAPIDSSMYNRAKSILALVSRASAPPWLNDAARALGEVRPEDGAPLALNWTQVIKSIYKLRKERDYWKNLDDKADHRRLVDLPDGWLDHTPDRGPQ